ncbi:MAG: LysM peptidoglycan-binding domain-containing protein, partial [Anaerolineae bacterium]
MNEHRGSRKEQGVRHPERNARSVGSRRNGSAAETKQLLAGLLVTLVSVGMLLGGFLLSQLDTDGGPPPPTQRIARGSTLTPFLPTFTPQSSPTTPGTEAGPTETPEGETAVTEMAEAETTVTEVPEGETATTAKPIVVPTQPPAPLPVCTRPPGWIAYTVKRGDTLARLAQQAGVTTLALMRANCLSTSTLVPGELIYLPAAFYARPTPEAYPCGPPWDWVVYIVQPGDTLYSLSRRFNVGVEAIRSANCLASYAIYAGQALYVPPLPPTPWPTPWPTATPTTT